MILGEWRAGDDSTLNPANISVLEMVAYANKGRAERVTACVARVDYLAHRLHDSEGGQDENGVQYEFVAPEKQNGSRCASQITDTSWSNQATIAYLEEHRSGLDVRLFFEDGTPSVHILPSYIEEALGRRLAQRGHYRN
jgi:hypothetical protein